MDVFELIQKRESCRDYSDERVPREKLNALIEAARLAPSGHNGQPWRFVVVDDAKQVLRFAECVYDKETGINRFAAQVPAYIVAIENQTKKRFSSAQFSSQGNRGVDIGIATGYLTLAATETGLSTCIMSWIDREKIKKLLSVPEELYIHLAVAVGYAKSPEIRQKKRKAMEEIASYNSY